jgi:hypothetical protein
MATGQRRRTRCPYCDQDVAITTTGDLYSHGGVGSAACVGSGRRVAEVEQAAPTDEPFEGFWFDGTFYPAREG